MPDPTPPPSPNGEYWIGLDPEVDKALETLSNGDPGAYISIMKTIYGLAQKPYPEKITKLKVPYIDSFFYNLKIEPVKQMIIYSVDDAHRHIYILTVSSYIA